MSYRIYLYNEIPKEDLDLKLVVAYLAQKCSFAVIEVRSSIILHFYTKGLIKGLADAWQIDLSGEGAFNKTEEERLDYERKAYLKPETISPRIVYNGWFLEELLQSKIPQEEAAQDKLHIFLTPRLMVTKEYMARRYHARTILAGRPSIVSSSGLVEAPARPMEYYIFRTGYQVMGQEIPDSVLKKKFEGQFLDYHDPRLTEVILGYLLQAVAYRFFGEGFCEDPRCRLFNAHTQQEMLVAQLEPPEFCYRHQTLFSRSADMGGNL
jgi:hypothetical protein